MLILFILAETRYTVQEVQVEEKKMIRLFACDMDGTLLNLLHTTDPYILKMIRKVDKNGKIFAIATGRNMRDDQFELDFKHSPVYCICMNGAMILDPERHIIYERLMDHSVVREILEQFPEIRFQFIGRYKTYMQCSREENKAQIRKVGPVKKLIRMFSDRRMGTDLVFDQTKEDILNQPILKVNCRIYDKELQQRFDAYLETRKDRIVNAPYAEGIYEITASGVDKGQAVKALGEILGIQEQETAVYGDGGNDIEMLSAFDHSYVTSNACDRAKQVAHHELGHYAFYSVPRHILKTMKKDSE